MEWQPIETAPKDGTEIIIYCTDTKPCMGAFVADMGWCAPARFPGSWIDLPDHPTHWMPLPPPPHSPDGER